MIWAGIVVLAVGTYALKALGPVALGARPLPPGLARLVALLPSAVLAALIAVSTFGDDRALTLDARAAGVAVAALAVWRQAPFIVVILAAAATTALLRAVT